MSTANTGTDDINLAPENDDFDDVNVDIPANDDGSGDTTGQGNINVPAAPAAGGANGPTNINLRVEQNKIPEFLVPKARTPFPLQISSNHWRIWPEQTDGRTPRPTTTSPTPSGTRHESGSHP
jgi:hypothetical protein